MRKDAYKFETFVILTFNTMKNQLLIFVCLITIPVLKAQVVINEIMTGGQSSASNEFVEIYNNSDKEIDIGEWRLVYKSPSGTKEYLLYKWEKGKVLKADEYFVIGGESFLGNKDADLKYSLSGKGGGVALRSNTNNFVDAVGYGPLNDSHNFIETQPCPLPNKDKSISRVPNGVDSNNNFKDFNLLTDVTPGEPNGFLKITSFLDENEIKASCLYKGNGVINIVLNGLTDQGIINIFDVNSRMVFSEKVDPSISEFEANLKEYSQGIYFVKIFSPKNQIVAKVIIP